MHCIPCAFSQCFIHLDVCLYVENCVLIGLDWVEPMMQIFFAYHMFMHFSCIRTLSILYILAPVVMVFLSLSLSHSLRIAPKCKFTPSRNPFLSEASSSDPTPLHIQFRDEKARQDISENFSKRGLTVSIPLYLGLLCRFEVHIL